ncbi:LuxR C-terminal-related transcriptional regulator [Actinoplanes sp. NPDC051346]|uniref:helix-turn-helix transcriptional regulator n=1 Tax=Actinoplanes sp. NPDC051346 TaxID=3155048 RepID=UPI00342E7040
MSEMSARGYRKILDLIMALLDCPNPPAWWSLVARELADALHGDASWLYRGVDLEINTAKLEAFSPEVIERVPLQSLLDTHMPRHPIARYYSATRNLTPATVHDFVGERTWRNSATGSELRSQLGLSRQLALPVPAAGGELRAFLVSKSGRNFSFSDRELAQRIQALLIRIDRHSSELQKLHESRIGRQSGELPTVNMPADDVGVTPRELTVLGLLAEGLTAKAIARRLGITVRTVTKHQEKLYRKLGTQDRLSSVLLAHDIGLISR